MNFIIINDITAIIICSSSLAGGEEEVWASVLVQLLMLNIRVNGLMLIVSRKGKHFLLLLMVQMQTKMQGIRLCN